VSRRLHATHTMSVEDHVVDAYAAATVAGLVHQAQARWPSEGWRADARPEMTRMKPNEPQALFSLSGGALGLASLGFGTCYGFVSAESPEAAEAGLAELRKLVPASAPIDDGTVPVTFWSYGPHGPESVRRRLDAPAWADIALNYPEATRAQLERMMDGFRPGRGGQLVLWHGDPGTGKTTALRALAREWGEWAELDYIADPEQFFGEHANYMLSVMLRAEEDTIPAPVSVGGRQAYETRPRESWRVLVLEDTGELLQADARAQVGQSLSRFLNAVDGLIGQGLRVLVLVTTNEKVDRLHPAVARPGRCAADVEYHRFDRVTATDWLAARDPTTELPRALGAPTLADLYALVEGYEGARLGERLGFA
jgi:hypothetical protein